MNDSLPPSVLSLESLPDELFYDIFEYLSVRDLYDGFYHLNYRFVSILASLTNLYAEMTIKEEAHSPAFRFFAQRITVLRVEHVESIDLSPFSAIHSLRLHTEPNRSQCQSIQLLSHLQHVSVDKPPMKHSYYSVSLSSFVFTNSFPSLRSCRLHLIPFKDNQQWTLVPSLHTLDINVGDPRVYPQILHSCPSLVRFKLEFIRYFAKPPKMFPDSSHASLRRLDLCLSCTTFSSCQIIDLLLSLVPNLVHFSVAGSFSDATDINIDSLAIILNQRVPKLNQFYLEMAIQESLVSYLQYTNNWQKTRQLHPIFNYLKMNPSTQNAPARFIIDSKRIL